MTYDEFDAFLHYLADERLAVRLQRIRDRRGESNLDDEVKDRLGRLRRAHEALNYIDVATEDDWDVYRAFTLQWLSQIIRYSRSGLEFQNSLLEETEILEVIDSHFAELAAGIRLEHLPANEAELLTVLGFPRVGAHLPGIVFAARMFAQRWHTQGASVGRELNALPHRLEEAEQSHDRARDERRGIHWHGRGEPDQPPLCKRKWWTGLGKIVTGSAIAIADIALGAGLLPFQVTMETRTWGALSSAAVGVGQVLEGVGCRSYPGRVTT